jgi:hypothetical protein
MQKNKIILQSQNKVYFIFVKFLNLSLINRLNLSTKNEPSK